MKSTKGPSREFLQKGALATLPWVTVSRRSAPPAGAPSDSGVNYGVRSSEDIARGFGGRDNGNPR